MDSLRPGGHEADSHLGTDRYLASGPLSSGNSGLRYASMGLRMSLRNLCGVCPLSRWALSASCLSPNISHGWGLRGPCKSPTYSERRGVTPQGPASSPLEAAWWPGAQLGSTAPLG